jgi:hypothetical protein
MSKTIRASKIKMMGVVEAVDELRGDPALDDAQLRNRAAVLEAYLDQTAVLIEIDAVLLDKVSKSESSALGSLVSQRPKALSSSARVAKGKLLTQAAELLGSPQSAAKWVDRPIPSLDGLTPLQLIETPEGAASFENYMNQIRYGVYI